MSNKTSGTCSFILLRHLSDTLHLQQVRVWIRNHKNALLGDDHGRNSSEGPGPAYIELQEYKAEAHVGRARSARDIFIAEHPDIRKQAEQASRDEGFTTRSDITTRVNTAYTEAIKTSTDWADYEARSLQEKSNKAAERQALKNVREGVRADSPDGSPGRDKCVQTICVPSCH